MSDSPPAKTSPSSTNVAEVGKECKGIFQMFREAKARFVNAVLKPPIFLRSPKILEDVNKEYDDTPPPGTLNYPFQPLHSKKKAEKCMNASSGSAGGAVCDEMDLSPFIQSGDLEVLDKKVTDMEVTVKTILNDDKCDDGKAKDPPKDGNPTNVEGFNGLVSNDISKTKLPVSIYAELMAIYEALEFGDISRATGICSPKQGQGGKAQGKEKNLRNEVLKWNKD